MTEKLTRSMQIQKRKENILICALRLFSKNGLEETSIEKVSQAAGCGPASVYRYFETKAALAIACARFYWKRTSRKYVDEFFDESYLTATGYEQMKCIMKILQKIYLEEQDFLKFLQEFDVFVKKYKIKPEYLLEYEQEIMNLKEYVILALKKGRDDKTLYFEDDCESVYNSMMHAMISLMQKLSIYGMILPSDQKIEGYVQVQILTKILLRGIAA